MTAIIPKATIFLDIDGVLAPIPYPPDEELDQKVAELFPNKPIPKRYGWGFFSKEDLTVISHSYFSEAAVQNLEKLIQRVQEVAQCRIVISSSWRLCGNLDEVKEMLKKHSFCQHIIDKTPDLLFRGRGLEISSWLNENKALENYAIFDDCDYGVFRDHRRNFVHVDREKLLTEQDCEKAYQILARESTSTDEEA